ncbi:hypothetical protein D3C75_629320 [compost metagenome]
MALEHVQHAGGEAGQWRALGDLPTAFDQAAHGTVARHGDVGGRHCDHTGFGVADEIHAIQRFGDEAEGRNADHEHAQCDGDCLEAAEGAQARSTVLLLARLGEVVALQGAEYVADADQLTRQVAGDDVPQRGDVARFKVLELRTDTAIVRVVRAHLELDVDRQAQVVDHELQAPAQHIAHRLRLLGVEAQAAGRKVFDLDFVDLALGVQEPQLGGNAYPGVLALGFGLMHDIDVHGGIHGGLFLLVPIRVGLTRP